MITEAAPHRKWKRISAQDLGAAPAGLHAQLVDVREPLEFAGGRIAGALLMPLATLQTGIQALDRSRPIICICRSGKRAAAAAQILAGSGFEDVMALDGGMLAWERAGLAVEKDMNAPWALDRQVRLAAGLLVCTGLIVSLFFPWAIALTWFMGAGLVFSALADWCGMGLLLARAPWNRRAGYKSSCCTMGN